ncbi:MAG: GNAT family N-acetyltransferase [Spirochaetaceae bacterium]|jgi:Leu/Phe-tRNA-protein transferase|nr:GNAT family N-acetyltransferase [Spirochaetaceae bacterium]
MYFCKTGEILINPGDDPRQIVDFMLYINYSKEFCFAMSFDPAFIADLMGAGFLVMSARFADQPENPGESRYLLLPKLHLTRSVLFFPDIRETKTVRRLLKRYELRFDTDFDRILNRCVEVHGNDWLTPPLLESIRLIRERSLRFTLRHPGKPVFTGSYLPVRPVSFGVYRDEKLVAGEFGIIAGKVYTSYSGYRDEDSAGTVQMVLTGNYLQEKGFAFWDLGMPLPYKNRLGAFNVDPPQFVELFRRSVP